MRTLDKFEAIADGAQFPVCILGNPQTSDFALIDLDRPLPEGLEGRGLFFIGVIGLSCDGAAKIALAEPLDRETVSTLSQAFVRHVEGAIKAMPWPVPPDMRDN